MLQAQAWICAVASKNRIAGVVEMWLKKVLGFKENAVLVTV